MEKAEIESLVRMAMPLPVNSFKWDKPGVLAVVMDTASVERAPEPSASLCITAPAGVAIEDMERPMLEARVKAAVGTVVGRIQAVSF